MFCNGNGNGAGVPDAVHKFLQWLLHSLFQEEPATVDVGVHTPTRAKAQACRNSWMCGCHDLEVVLSEKLESGSL